MGEINFMKKIMILICIIIIFTGFTKLKTSNAINNSSKLTSTTITKKSLYLSPQQVIINHFKALQAKNIKKLNTTLSQRFRGCDFGMYNLKYIRLLNIREIRNSLGLQNILQHFTLKEKPKYSKEFGVTYRIKYINNKKAIDPFEGITSKLYILFKQNENSPWLIWDLGS
jgi:hypothetical protein